LTLFLTALPSSSSAAEEKAAICGAAAEAGGAARFEIDADWDLAELACMLDDSGDRAVSC
jgi:hypothetical protein